MDSSQKEKALEAIKATIGTEEGEYGIDLFISHHPEELSKPDWQNAIGIEEPTPNEVFNALVLQECWDDENGIAYDFTLPNDATNYLISVRFDEEGNIEDIAMES